MRNSPALCISFSKPQLLKAPTSIVCDATRPFLSCGQRRGYDHGPLASTTENSHQTINRRFSLSLSHVAVRHGPNPAIALTEAVHRRPSLYDACAFSSSDFVLRTEPFLMFLMIVIVSFSYQQPIIIQQNICMIQQLHINKNPEMHYLASV